jgi:hypothetical protein
MSSRRQTLKKADHQHSSEKKKSFRTWYGRRRRPKEQDNGSLSHSNTGISPVADTRSTTTNEEDLIRRIVRKMIREEGEALLREEADEEGPSIKSPPDDTVEVEDVEESSADHYGHFIKSKRVTNKKFDQTVKSIFPGAVDNYELVKHVTSILVEKKGCRKPNTLLATSLCCDEASRQLEEDFQQVYGRNFNLGGLAGFPWAGQTGFGAMAHHIPEDGHCIVVYGPHVGITQEAVIGKVERAGIACPDECCGSAVAASNYVKQLTHGEALISANIQQFTDFQQGAVQQMILPHCKRLDDAEDRMKELPYAMFDSQDLLMRKITEPGAGATRNGLILLGGVQINTGPTTADYFHPLRFCFMNREGVIVEDLMPDLHSRVGVHVDAEGDKAIPTRPSIRAEPDGRLSTVLTQEPTPSPIVVEKKLKPKMRRTMSFKLPFSPKNKDRNKASAASAHEPAGSHRPTKSIWGGTDATNLVFDSGMQPGPES